jgi:hypothetical protein
MTRTAAAEIIAATPCAAFIMPKNMKVLGKTAPNAKSRLKLKCTYIMERTNSILRNFKIRLPTSQRYVPSAA